MGFWGVEVKPNEPMKIKPELFKIVNISQAALGEVKDPKGAEHVSIYLRIGDEKYVIGTLSAEDTPQLMLDLVFEREFELSHDWKHGSIYFVGYVSRDPSIDYEVDRDISNEDEGNPFNAFLAGKLAPKAQYMKPMKEESEFDSDDDGEDDSDDGDESEDLEGDSTDDSADMAESLEKSSSVSATQTPIPSKKAKLARPEKKGDLSANSPKKTVQTSGNDKRSKKQNAQSSHQDTCKPCSKTFNSEKALESHNKAKHSGK